MSIYYSDDKVTLYHGDALEILPTLPAASVDAVIADPPYNIGKAEWDWISGYRAWNAAWVALASQALIPQGAFWCFHSEPLDLADIAREVERHGRPLVSWITLDKSSWGITKRYRSAGTKTFPASVEYATYSRREVYAEQVAQLRTSLGMSRAEFDIEVSPSRKPTGITYRWEHGERIPQRAEIDTIREKYSVELTTPTFANPTKCSVVWPFPQVSTADHPTAKPASVVARMVGTTTAVGDIILDPFAGSGTLGRVAKDMGRSALLIEQHEPYCEIAARRLSQEVFDFGALA